MISVCPSLVVSLDCQFFAFEMLIIMIDQTWHWNNYIFDVY